MSVPTSLRLGVASLAVLTFAADAHAEEAFHASYETREGVAQLSVALDVAAPRGGETRITADGQGLLAYAGGDGTGFELLLAAHDGRRALWFEPARECTPNREGGCSFALPLVDADGRETGVTARVIVASGAGPVHPALVSDAVEMATDGFGRGLSTGISVDARPDRVDLEIYVELDFDGHVIDFTRFDGRDVDPPDPDADPPDPDRDRDHDDRGTSEVYRVFTYNVAALPQTAFSDDNFNPDDDYVERGIEIADFILDNDYDIVVLNEVVVDEMRDTLIDELKAEYPYIIREAWDGDADTTHRQDSGLMLFSRFPGDPVDIGTECSEGANIDVIGLDDGGGTTTTPSRRSASTTSSRSSRTTTTRSSPRPASSTCSSGGTRRASTAISPTTTASTP